MLMTIVALSTVSCKKDYNCTAVDEAGIETVLKCTNCSKKDVSDYEQSILDKGYVTADCAK